MDRFSLILALTGSTMMLSSFGVVFAFLMKDGLSINERLLSTWIGLWVVIGIVGLVYALRRFDTNEV